MEIIARAPTRIDLAGGTIDLNPICHAIEGRPVTVNVAVDLWAETKISLSSSNFVLESANYGTKIQGSYVDVCSSRELPLLSQLLEVLWNGNLPSIHLQTNAICPPGAGLGGSSALAVSIVFGIKKLLEHLGESTVHIDTKMKMMRVCQNIEAKIIDAPTGCQDYLGALYGGLNHIRHTKFGTEVESIEGSELATLEQQILVCYCGQSRASALNNWSVFKGFFDGDEKIRQGLQRISDLSEKVSVAVQKSNWEEAMEFSREEWETRKSMWPDIETQATKAVDSLARKNGALFSRVCGAGGGGMMVVWTNKHKRSQIADALQKEGFQVYPVSLGVPGVHCVF